MKTIEIEVKKIKANPFKKFINNGKLEEEIISKLVEGFKQTTFHENLCGRENEKGEIELVYGHHRLEAVKKVYGENHKISIKVYSVEEFSDEKMLLDMIRENMTHRGDNYKDLSDSVMLVKQWLESKANVVKELNNFQKQQGKRTDLGENHIDARQVANFLAKQGKAISYVTISKIISIEENLNEDVKEQVAERLGRGTVEENKIGTELAYKISSIDKKEQKEILESVKESKKELSEEKIGRLLTQYKNSSEKIKEKVIKGEVSLTEIPMENLKENIKKKIEEQKEKGKGKIVVTHYKQYEREAGNRIGKTNNEIIQTCVYLNGLDTCGVLFELDWKTMLKIIEAGTNGSKNYNKFMEKILHKIN